MSTPDPASIPHARDAVRALVASQIREVANVGMGDPSVLAFWFGEPDEVTPAFIRDAGVASLARGETFYTQNLGIPPLRDAIAAYVGGLHRPRTADHIAVTASGMSALMLIVEALVAPGDRVVVVTPLWPNLVEIPKILAANVECVPLDFSAQGWTLDLDRLLAALTHETRVLLVNSPNKYNTSCSPAFVQHAGVAAIRDGEPTVARTRGRLADGVRRLERFLAR